MENLKTVKYKVNLSDVACLKCIDINVLTIHMCDI